MSIDKILDSGKFWDPNSLETLIFSNFVGAAAIVDFHDNQTEILRVNPKYLKELSMNLSEKEVIKTDLMQLLDNENQKIYQDTLKQAIYPKDEEECETWRSVCSSCCGEEKICIRSTLRMIGKSEVSHLFYVMIRNVTQEKQNLMRILDSERRFKAASEQVNIYYWE